MKRYRAWLYQQLEPPLQADGGLSRLNQFIIAVILSSVLVVVIESESTIAAGHVVLFRGLELVFGLFFLVEHVLRVWISTEDPRYGPGLAGRMRYMLSPVALLDLVAVIPVFFLLAGTEAYMLRVARLLRVLRLGKLGRFSRAVSAISDAIASRRFELIASVCFALALLLISSTLMYLLEASIQPEHFGSIPRAMWWSVVTLTTVGYGDAYPVTTAGRILAGLTAVTGIGLIAMPTGILAAAFSDALQAKRTSTEHGEAEDDTQA